MHSSNIENVKTRIIDILNWSRDVIYHAKRDASVWTQNQPEKESIPPLSDLEKMLSEASVLALISSRTLGPNHKAILDLLDAIEEHTESLHIIYDRIRQHPSLWARFGLIWIVLDKFSRGDPDTRARLQWLYDKDIPQPHEQIPFRALDDAWARLIATGKTAKILTSVDFLSTTALANVEAAPFMNIRGLYALTHCVFYCTDFSRVNSPVLTQREWMGSIGLYALLVHNMDLSAEFAISEICVSPDQIHAGTSVVVAILDSLYANLGYIPGPSMDTTLYKESRSPRSYLEFHCYHPTFVYGLLCSVIGTTISHENVSELATLINATKPSLPPTWRNDVTMGLDLSTSIAHTVECWRMMLPSNIRASKDSELIRGVIDAYIIESLHGNRISDLYALLGMIAVAGASSVDASVRAFLDSQVQLAR